MKDPPSLSRLPFWARATDVVVVALAALGVLIALFGGFRVRLDGVRLSLTSPLRVWLWAAALAVVRHLIHRRNPIYRRLLESGRLVWRSTALAAAWPPFLGTRLPVLLVGFLAVVTIGYPVSPVPVRVSENELWNLPSRWDAGWYLQIAARGYHWDPNPTHEQSVVFFPAYPMLMRIGGRLLGQRPLLAGQAISLLAFLAALAYLYRLARERLDEGSAKAALALLAAYPFALFFSAVYTESLFLLGAVAACYHFGRGELVKAGAWGLLTGLTRPNGCFLSIVLAVMILEQRFAGWRAPAAAAEGQAAPRPRALAALVATAMPGIGMLLYSAFVYSLSGHPFAWARAHMAWGRTLRGLDTLVMDRYRYIAEHGFYGYSTALPVDMLNGVAALFALAAIAPTVRHFGTSYGVFVAVNLIPPLFAGGLMSVGRFTAVLFPVFLWLARAVPPDHRSGWIGAFAIGQAFCAALFFTWRALY